MRAVVGRRLGALVIGLLWWSRMALADDRELATSRKCGDTSCPEYQYCSDSMCHPCSTVCTQGHNYDHKLCERVCQDFIRDHVKRYLTEADLLKATRDLQDEIEWLRTLVAVSITISCIIGVVVVAGLGFWWLTYRRKRPRENREKDMLEKKMTAVSVICNNNDSDSKDKGSLRLEMPTMPTGTETNSSVGATNNMGSGVHGMGGVGRGTSVVTATTPISTRHPSEDATLEFAYDNPALTPSPVLNQPRHETTF